MTLNSLRIIARALTGSTYAILGYDALTAPGGRVELAAGTLDAMRSVLPLPEDDEVVVRANAAVMVVAGTTLALGIAPRISAAALFCSMVPTTIAGHGFWAVEDPAARKLQRTQFHKNLAMLGGLLLAVVEPPDPR